MITAETKERPILFSGPMVRAILEGRKTQTRRIVKDQPGSEAYITPFEGRWIYGGLIADIPQDRRSCRIECPYGQPGERLWVREAFCANFKPMIYQATATSDTYGGEVIKYKPSIHMPRRMSRINLEITGVRVERLNDISEADAIAEGIEPVRSIWKLYGQQMPGFADATGQPRKSYASLWASINGPGSWAANPWVWVVEFKVV